MTKSVTIETFYLNYIKHFIPMKKQIKVIAPLLFWFILSSCSKDSISLIVPEKGIDLTATSLSYEERRDNKYGTNGYQSYDMYLPSTRNTRNPVIVLLHGGAWRLSDKYTLNFVVNDLKTKRVNCAIVNANYRLAVAGSGVTYKQQVEDIGALLHKIAADAKALGIGTKFYLVGMSAGGHLALLYASTADSEGLVAGVGGIAPPVDLTTQGIRGGIIGADVRQEVGKSYTEAPEEYKNASPVYQYNGKKVPCIVFYGGKDGIVTSDQSDLCKSNITGKLSCNQFHFYPDQTHDWSAWAETEDKLIAFAEKNF